MDLDNSILFFAIDGDDVGLYLRDYIVSNDLDGASSFSQALSGYFEKLRGWMIAQNSRIIFCGGDSILACGQPTLIEKLKSEIELGPCTISIGIGETSEKAYLALQLAKARGKSQIVIIHDVKTDTIKRWNKTEISFNKNGYTIPKFKEI